MRPSRVAVDFGFFVAGASSFLEDDTTDDPGLMAVRA